MGADGGDNFGLSLSVMRWAPSPLLLSVANCVYYILYVISLFLLVLQTVDLQFSMQINDGPPIPTGDSGFFIVSSSLLLSSLADVATIIQDLSSCK